MDGDGKLLSQTKERPSSDTAFFRAFEHALWEAIQQNDADVLRPYFFPQEVYLHAKDSKNPARDWRFRLWAQLERDIAKYHRRLGKHRERAVLIGLKTQPRDALWLEPGREYNRLPYFRLFGSNLEYEDHRGRRRRLEVTALLSWRGEWYLIHLNGLR